MIAGPASSNLAEKIAKQIGVHMVTAELRVFSDGESKIRMSKTGKNCVVVQSTYPPTDTHLVQALMLLKKCTDDGARDVCAVIPYLAYARQDRAFLEGEIASVALIAKLLEAAGVNHVITIDIHSKLAMSHFSSIQSISSVPLLANYAFRLKLHRPVAVSPDEGGADRTKEFAKCLNTDMIVLKKSRDRTTGEVAVDEKLDIDVSGREAILLDDIISSGGSIIKAAELLRKKGASKVYAMCAHGLLIDNAAQKIIAGGVQDIIATNSVPGGYAKIDLSPAIAEAVKSRYSSA